MDLPTAASLSVLDTDLERLLQEQTRKLSALGIFPPARRTSEAYSAGSQPVCHSTDQPSTIPTPNKVDHSSSDGRRSAGDAAAGRLDRLAQSEERIARLLGVERGDGGGGATSNKCDYEALLRPAMVDMPHCAADLLNRIRQKSLAQNAVADPVKPSPFNTVHANTQISRRKTVVEKRSNNSALVTKSESQLNTKKAAGKIRDRVGTLNSEMSAKLIIGGKSSEDTLSYVDISAKTLGQEATVQMMKGKLAAKEAELMGICQTASKHQQLAQHKAAEVRQMEEEYRQIKAKQMAQEKQLRACRMELEEARGTSEALRAEVERLSAEVRARGKGQVEVAKKKALPQISLARLAAANDRALQELATLKEHNKVLMENGQKLREDVEKQRKRHEGNLTRFLTVVKKQQALMICTTRQKTLSGQMQLLKTADDKFRQLIDANSITSAEECALMQAACVTLTEGNKPSKFAFWGKINGLQNDYYIVQSYVFVPQELPATFYSRDGLTWSNLAAAADVLISSGAYLNGPFTGEPTTPYTYSVSDPLSSNATERKPPVETTIREEERLAYVVRCVDGEGMMIPKYSYDNEVVGPVLPAPSYRGMSFDDCSNLENYLTFKPTNKAQWRSAAAAGDRPKQMLQPLLHSCPENLTDHPRWRLCERTNENLVVFQNIHWPGLIFHHAIDGTSFGRFYCGRGLREISVPFLFGAAGDTVLSVDISIVPDYDMNVSYEERQRIKKEKLDAETKAAAEADFDERYEAGGSVYSSEGEQIENAELLETGDVQPIDYSTPPSQADEDTEASDNDTTANTSAYTTGGGDTTELDTSDTESTP